MSSLGKPAPREVLWAQESGPVDRLNVDEPCLGCSRGPGLESL